MRSFIAVCAAALLAGCVSPQQPQDTLARPRLAAAGAIVAPPAPQLGEDRFVAADGVTLPLRRWLPRGEPRAVVLALHGFNDYSNAFAGPGAAWAERGIATFAYDQRGFGAAPGRGRWAGPRQLAEDAATAMALLHRRYPGVPVYLLGESMGGGIAILAASGRSGAPVPAIDGVILVAPAVWGRQTMTLFERVGLWLADLVPSIKLSADVLPVRIRPSDNVRMLRAYSADPLVIKDTRADALTGLVDLMSAALAAGPWFDAPAFLLYGEHDEIVPRAPVAQFVDSLPVGARLRQRIALYPQGYHMLLRDLGARRPIDDVAAWIADRAAPLPSGADRGARTNLTGHAEPLAASAR